MLAVIARVVDRRALAVVLVSAAVTVIALLFGAPVTAALSGGAQDFRTAGSSSAIAAERLAELTGLAGDGGVVVLVQLPNGPQAPDSIDRIGQVAGELRADPSVGSVISPVESQNPAQVSTDQESAYLVAHLRADADPAAAAQSLQDRFAGQSDVELGGGPIVDQQVTATVQRDLQRAELLAFPVLFLLSLWIFRSLVASALPVLIGGINILLTLLALRVVSEFVDMSIFALNLVIALGLGLAIDYSLLVVSRFRGELAAGADVSDAVRTTVLTAGRTIAFSALTVAAAMASLLVFEQRFLRSMAIGGVLVALLSAVVAVLLLPAALRLVGRKIDFLAPPRWQRQLQQEESTSGRWFRIAATVTGRPKLTAVAAVAVLLLLAAPFLTAQFTFISASTLPESQSGRTVDDALSRDFAENPADTIQVVLSGIDITADTAADLAGRITEVDGVSAVGPPVPLGDSAYLVPVSSASGPLTEQSRGVVEQIRALPTRGDLAVGGQTAQFVDLRASLGSQVLLAILLVCLGNMVVLAVMTGSVVLPIKAVLMNFLTLGATFGLLVLIFQDGHFAGLLGTTGQGALETTQPVLLFALVFGLSTDYGVFLLSRIKEARDAGADDRQAVILGVGRTGRIVTAAALLFCVALGALATSDIVFIKELGIGTALGVLIDATIVRALLVPSLMVLLGRWNWAGPRWLQRVHQRFGSELPPELRHRSTIPGRMPRGWSAHRFRPVVGRHRSVVESGAPPARAAHARTAEVAS
jgi:uncharacterized membrane protein YdfJ with MMPL/SSD domain